MQGLLEQYIGGNTRHLEKRLESNNENEIFGIYEFLQFAIKTIDISDHKRKDHLLMEIQVH